MMMRDRGDGARERERKGGDGSRRAKKTERNTRFTRRMSQPSSPTRNGVCALKQRMWRSRGNLSAERTATASEMEQSGKQRKQPRRTENENAIQTHNDTDEILVLIKATRMME